MAVVREFRGKAPRIAGDVFLAESATLTGDVEVGAEASIWYGAVLRGDVGWIRIGARTNVQDLACIHLTEAESNAEIGEEVLIAAGTLVPPRMVVPAGSLVRGHPGRVVRPLTAEERARGRLSAAHYVELARAYR